MNLSMEKKNKIKNIGIAIGILLFFAITCLIIYEAIDFANDYRCSNLPLNEFFQDESCKKYWRYEK
jgi:hypothetical protein